MPTDTPQAGERRNALLLAAAQALFQTSSVVVVTASGVVGLVMAPDPRLATLPVAMMTVGATLTMIPASLLMQRIGRKAGFALGAMLGSTAGLLAATAIQIHSFWLFVLANMVVGTYTAFSAYYRFAAADVASDAFRSRAISWVVAGGVVAAVAGPNLVRFTQHALAPEFVATYLAMFALGLCALGVISRLSIAPPAPSLVQAAGRPLREIVRQPKYLTALASSTVGFTAMAMVMTATPLAMIQCGHAMGASATAIQWHVLGMFVPSFFTGALIRRWGVLNVMRIGIVLFALEILVALSGIGFAEFLGSMVLLGVGWNFLFIGGTTLLTETYRPEERARAQAAHDFLMFSAVSVASLAAGGLLEVWGWNGLNLTVVPMLAIAAVAVTMAGRSRKEST